MTAPPLAPPPAAMMRALRAALIRAYVSRELPGWGRLYRGLVGGAERDGDWAGAAPRIIRDKRHGFHRIVDPRDWADRLLYFLGRWYDLPTALLIERALAPGGRVLDVGANYGHFAMAAAAAVGPEGHVTAVEPNPVACARLRTHVALNRLAQIEIHRIGLADAPGELTLEIPAVNSGEASFAGGQYADVRRVPCPVTTGDALLAGAPVDFVKIDVEGFELRVLQGLAGTIERCRPLILTEVRRAHLARAGVARGDLFACLGPLGYSAWRLGLARGGGARRLALAPAHADGPDGDLLWCAEGRAGRLAALLTGR